GTVRALWSHDDQSPGQTDPDLSTTTCALVRHSLLFPSPLDPMTTALPARSLEVERHGQKVLDGFEGCAVGLRVIRDRDAALETGAAEAERLRRVAVLPHRLLLQRAPPAVLCLGDKHGRRQQVIIEAMLRVRILGQLHILARLAEALHVGVEQAVVSPA